MSQALKTSTKLPLCVDLDGTLVKSDTLIEAIFRAAKKSFWQMLLAPLWLRKGKPFFKEKIFALARLDVTQLPYNEKVVAYLKDQHQAGRKIILATASPKIIAQPIAEHLGFFDEVMATDLETNLSGKCKAKALVEKFGDRQFDYMGNAGVDLHVWRHSAHADVVFGNQSLVNKAKELTQVNLVIPRPRSFFKLVKKAIRVHQWTKNALVFLPIVLAHKISDLVAIGQTMHAFFAFAMTASSVYLINDLLDLESDRHHPDNKSRPFASGELALHWGVLLAPVLLSFGLLSAAALSPAFFMVVFGYFILTCAYSLHFKEIALLDVIILAFLYAWRIFAGAVAIDITLSHWLLVFAGFFFLSLALVKRCSELILMDKENLEANPRRGYWVADLGQLVAMGSASGYLAVLVFALYISSEQVVKSYQNPEVLWLMCPFLLYWISRMWLKAYRGMMHTDPLVFAVKDRSSYIIMAIMALIWFIATGKFMVQ
jgi:4-hydroxybenzoate polyprenyltransferase